MKVLLKILIALIIFEIIIGYVFYLGDSTRLTGNYISSTLKALDKITNKTTISSIVPSIVPTYRAVGNVKHSTNQNKIGSSSIYFDGTGHFTRKGNHLISSQTYNTLGKNWTIEGWIYPTSKKARVFYAHGNSNDTDYFVIDYVGENPTVSMRVGGIEQFNLQTSGSPVQINQWNHLAVTRDNGAITIWINGVAEANTNYFDDMPIWRFPGTFGIRKGDDGIYFEVFKGYMDELRVSKIARYFSSPEDSDISNGKSPAFIPSNIAFITDDNTQLLIHSDKVNNSREFIDTSGSQSLDLNCKEKASYSHELEIADTTFYRRAIKFQTNIEFLNTSDFSDKYVIFIAGNSETYGVDQKEQERLHIVLQEKLRNKFKSKEILVVNVASPASLLNDQLKSVAIFSELYNPDLVIFYTGGNEVTMPSIYEDMLSGLNHHIFTVGNTKSLNIENEYWYEFRNDQYQIYQKCLDDKMFLTNFNFQKAHPSIDIQDYIKRGYKKINSYLDSKSIDYIFYIQPFNRKYERDNLDESKPKDFLIKKNILKLQDINILDKRFINLSNQKLNLDFTGLFHTRDSSLIGEKIFNNILREYEQKIINKIN